MRYLSKITVVATFFATMSFCEAMETNNSLSEGLEKLLMKTDVESFLAVSSTSLSLANGYTKCTDFKEDTKGNFVNSEGKYLQIFKALDTGYLQVADQMTTGQMITASSRDLLCCSVVASTSVTLMNINLSACAPINTSISLPFQVLDSLGIIHEIHFELLKSCISLWEVCAKCFDGAIDSIYTAGIPLYFDSYGNLNSINGNVAQNMNNAPQMLITWNNAASITYLNIDFGMLHTSRGLSATGMEADVSTPVVVDGGIRKYVTSTVNSKTGNFIAKFSDGSQLIYGKIPVITFEIPKINLY